MNSLDQLFTFYTKKKFTHFRNANVIKDLGLKDKYVLLKDKTGSPVLFDGLQVVVRETAAKQATGLLSAYKADQKKGRTNYIIHREAKTVRDNSIWVLGHLTADVQDTFNQHRHDTAEYADNITATMRRIARKNKHARSKEKLAAGQVAKSLRELGKPLK